EPQIAFVPRAVLDCADVALELGIGVFTEDHDRHVRLALELTRGTELRGAAGGAHDGLDCGENRLAVREILVLVPVPCQEIVHPPHCLGMLSAPSPATSTCACGLSGSR